MNVRKFFFTLLSLGFLLLTSSCNLPQSQRPPEEAEAVDTQETALAATVAAQVTQSLLENATPTPSQTPIPPTETPSPSPTVTPTYAPPMLRVEQNTNCRSGPGEAYNVIVVLTAGQNIEPIGPGMEGQYWVVKRPGTQQTCWAWGEFLIASGSVHTLPEITPPATVTPAPPAPPRGLTYAFSCTFTDVTVNLSWTDVATNESGYRVLRNDAPIAELPANTTQYTDVTAASSGSSFTYAIEVFNDAGTARSGSITFSCP